MDIGLDTLTHPQLTHTRSIDYMRWLSCLHEADGMEGEARYKFGLRFPCALNLELVKSAVAVGTTTDSTWAGPLAPLKPLTDAFLEYVWPKTLLGKIQGLRRVPFNVSVPSQTTGGTYTWVGQNKPKPVTKADYSTVNLTFAKASGIVVTTEEVARLSAPGSEPLLRSELAAGIAAFLDVQFVDPTVAEVTDVSPASITSGATSIASAGATAANALTDIKAGIASFTAANPDVEFMVMLMSPSNAAALAVATNSQTLTIAGGTLFGVPVVTSTALGTNIVILDAVGILFADDGGIEISTSRSALVQMDSTPTDPTVAATVFLNLYQRNLVASESTASSPGSARASAVRYLTGAAYV